jgi:hypothetical protein
MNGFYDVDEQPDSLNDSSPTFMRRAELIAHLMGDLLLPPIHCVLFTDPLLVFSVHALCRQRS